MRERQGAAAEKAAWRERFRDARRRLSAAERARASRAITARVEALLGEASVVSLFWPLRPRGEVDLRALIASRWRAGAPVALPVVGGTDPPRLVHRRVASEADLVDGPWGLREPAAACALVAPADVALAVVPGLGMGRDGSRVGYGGGFYDTFLAETDALRVGVVWADALVDALPAEPADARLDVVVTERETVWTGRRPTRRA